VRLPRITVSNLVHGPEPATLLRADVRLEFAPDLIVVARDVKQCETKHHGVFVGMPRRYLSDMPYRLVDFEGAAGAELLEAIRQALKAQLTTTNELGQEAHDERPF